MSAEVAATLRKAKALLAECGWTQGDFTNISGCFCAAGAINFAASGTASNLDRSYEPLILLAYALYDGDIEFESDDDADVAVEAVATVNDHPGTTVELALSAFDDAIAAAEAGR